MKISAEFKNGMCKLFLLPEDDWEQDLLGAVAKGGDKLYATINYESKGHFSYNKCAAVSVLLQAGEASGTT